MAKPSKRQKKFQASGGVKSRLQKGTITKKGKLRKRWKPKTTPAAEERERLGGPPPTSSLKDDDFMGMENLGDLDMDSFFAKFANKIQEAQEREKEEGAAGLRTAEPSLSSRSSESEESEQGNEKEVPKEGSSSSSSDDDSHSGSSPEPAIAQGKTESNGADSDSLSDEGSDDDDIEAAEAVMKKEMANMKDADPDFHRFLKENEESLLEFGTDEEKVEDRDPPDTEENGGVQGEKQEASSEEVLTSKVLDALSTGTFKSHGLSSLKKLVGAYKSACHLADADEEVKTRPGESGKQYVIESSKVFDQLMVLCLERCREAFTYHLQLENDDTGESADNKPLNPKVLERAEKWPEIRPILLSFFLSTIHVMSEAKEPELLTFILASLSKYVRLMSGVPTVAEALLKSLIALWSAPFDTSEDYQVVRLNSFFRIRQLAITQPFPFLEECLKKTYLAYARRAKFGTSSSVSSALPTLTFMGNCLVEIYSLDYHSSYQHAFIYIRQLALLLRAALQKKTPEALQQVYCWQYVHSLKLWVAVLSAAVVTDDGALMRALVYPLTEVIFGAVRLSSSSKYLPFRFHCVRLLQQLAAYAEVFIPTTSILLAALDLKELYLKPKKMKSGSSRPIELDLTIRFQVEALRMHEVLEPTVNELFVLIGREIELYRYSAGFPEFSIRILQRLRQFAKETRSTRWRSFARGCIDTCERYSQATVEGRSKLSEAPKDIQRLECLRPSSQPSMHKRHQEAIEKERKAVEALRSTTKPDDTAENNGDHEVGDGVKLPAAKKARKASKKAKSRPSSEAQSNAIRDNKDVMGQADQVREGVDWSSDDD